MVFDFYENNTASKNEYLKRKKALYHVALDQP